VLRASAIFGFALVACSDARDVPSTGLERSAIVHGTADTTHDAVVRITLSNASNGVRCSGTVIQNSGGNALVLTAGHCLDVVPTSVVVAYGDDSNNPTATYPAASWSRFPTTDQDKYDLALIELTGAPASVPSLPVLPPAVDAAFEVGHSFLAIGYGQTDVDAAVPHGTRQQIGMTLTAYQGTFLVLQNPAGSTCFGDSGGAIIDVATGNLAGVINGGSTCANGEDNAAIGLYAPPIAQWLDDNRQDAAAPDAGSSSSSSSSTSGTPTPTPPSPTPPKSDGSGCKQTSGSSSGLFVSVTLLAVTVLARRRKR
jgi:hypothetical protein